MNTLTVWKRRRAIKPTILYRVEDDKSHRKKVAISSYCLYIRQPETDDTWLDWKNFALFPEQFALEFQSNCHRIAFTSSEFESIIWRKAIWFQWQAEDNWEKIISRGEQTSYVETPAVYMEGFWRLSHTEGVLYFQEHEIHIELS